MEKFSGWRTGKGVVERLAGKKYGDGRGSPGLSVVDVGLVLLSDVAMFVVGAMDSWVGLPVSAVGL